MQFKKGDLVIEVENGKDGICLPGKIVFERYNGGYILVRHFYKHGKFHSGNTYFKSAMNEEKEDSEGMLYYFYFEEDLKKISEKELFVFIAKKGNFE